MMDFQRMPVLVSTSYGWLRDWVLKPERLEKVRHFGKLAAELEFRNPCWRSPGV